jgi:phosphatidate phosphatase APP1
MPTRRRLHRSALSLDRYLDRRRGATPAGRAIISPYRGFGREGELFVRGRALLDKKITRVREAEPLWQNLVNTYRRFHSEEIAGARVTAVHREAVVETVTDDEGHFQIRLQTTLTEPDQLWREINLELPDLGASAVAHVLVPPAGVEFAIISDIDDTVLQTDATSLVGMARSLVRNAATRLPFEGVADLYKALHRDLNPLFYVSSSPWNLYDLLHDFMDLNGIPHGPMFLQDWGIEEATFILASHTEHKLAQIQQIVDYYPALRFVLIGDSGQHDPEIYLRVIQTHPGRVIAAFIRDVTPDVRDHAVAALMAEAKNAGVEMLYVKDSNEALEHAKRLGLV